MPDWIPALLRFALDTFTLFVLLVGLFGLIMPVFPGLVIMWLGTLVYALIQNAAEIGRASWRERVCYAV